MSPRISVLLSVYNGEKYIAAAVRSILEQSYSDFEFIIVDDGSTDKTREILDQIKDFRIIRINNEKNLGLVRSLNRGLGVVRGEFVARMDADDMSTPDRFEKQIYFMDQNPAVGVLGTGMRQITEDGEELSVVVLPAAPIEVFWAMLFGLAVVHASVFIRTPIIKEVGGYNNDFIHIEDTELWSRLILKTQFSNLQDLLYIRRIRRGSIISMHSKLQLERTVGIKEQLFYNLIKKKVPREILAWFTDPTLPLALDQQALATATMNELYETLLLRAGVNEYKKISDDLNEKINSLKNSDRHRILRKTIGLLRGVLPITLKHKLRMSYLGKLIYRLFR